MDFFFCLCWVDAVEALSSDRKPLQPMLLGGLFLPKCFAFGKVFVNCVLLLSAMLLAFAAITYTN